MENFENVELEYMEELTCLSNYGIENATSWDISDDLKKQIKDINDTTIEFYDDDGGKTLEDYNLDKKGEGEPHIM